MQRFVGTRGSKREAVLLVVQVEADAASEQEASEQEQMWRSCCCVLTEPTWLLALFAVLWEKASCGS